MGPSGPATSLKGNMCWVRDPVVVGGGGRRGGAKAGESRGDGVAGLREGQKRFQSQ